MEALRIDAFANYTFLSGLRCGPQGELAFVAAQAEMEENSYRRDLWIKPPQGEPLQLTADGKTGGFLWDGPPPAEAAPGGRGGVYRLLPAGHPRRRGEAGLYRAPGRLSGGEGAGGGLPALGGLGLALLQGLRHENRRQGGPAGGEEGGEGLPGAGRAALLLQRRGVREQAPHRPVPL